MTLTRLARLQALRDYNPAQPRDDDGKWSGGSLFASAAKLQAALAAAPAKLQRAPEGHYGNYDGEALSGPEGMGTVRALSEYEGPDYANTNDDLRHDDLTDPEVAERVRQIDQTMSVSGLTDDAELHRVVRYGAAVFGKKAWYGDVIDFNAPFSQVDEMMATWESGERPNLTGLRWLEKGYSSTTADPAVVKDFGKRWLSLNSPLEGEPTIMRIFTPKGTGGVQLAEWGHAAEVLLQRDLTFEIIDDLGVGDDGYRYIDVKVVTA